MYKDVICVSGGIDSVLVLATSVKQKNKVYALHFNYGQKSAGRERAAVQNLVYHYKCESHFIILPMSTWASSSLFYGHVDDNEKTYVPFRNTIFTAIAASFAESISADRIGLGIHAETLYPDTTPEYADVLQTLLHMATKGSRKIFLWTPVIYYSKLRILKECIDLGVPLEHTWACYFSASEPCGKCPSCINRAKAFKKLNVKDPLYANSDN